MSDQGATGYGPSRYSRLYFSGDDGDYELWETRFMGYLELKDLKDVVMSTATAVDETKNSKAFSELIQYLDDRSLGLIMRDANGKGREAMKLLKEHYAGNGKEGYVLSKREFFDAITIRYMWDVKRLPSKCVCGKSFSVTHAMTCTNGGYIHRRHDKLRDLFAELLDEVATEVQTEPPLQPLSGELLPKGSNKEDEARLDIAARGFWQECEMAYFDVKVINPFAKSHLNVTLESALKSGERTKKRNYNERVIRVEHGTFTPIVFSSCGGNGFETGVFESKLIIGKRHIRVFNGVITFGF